MSELQTKDAVMNTKNDGSSQYSQTCIVGYLVAWICNSHTPEARIIQRNQASSPRTQVPWTLCLGQLKEQSQPFRVLLSVRKGFAVGLNLVPNTNCYSCLKRICSWVKATVWKSEVPGLGRAWQGGEGGMGRGRADCLLDEKEPLPEVHHVGTLTSSLWHFWETFSFLTKQPVYSS